MYYVILFYYYMFIYMNFDNIVNNIKSVGYLILKSYNSL